MISNDVILNEVLSSVIHADTMRTLNDSTWIITFLSKEVINSKELNMVIPLYLSNRMDNPFGYSSEYPCYFSPAFYENSLSEEALREEWQERGVHSISINYIEYKRLMDMENWDDKLEYLKELLDEKKADWNEMEDNDEEDSLFALMDNEEYGCPNCGCTEFIGDPSVYFVYTVTGRKQVTQESSETTDEEFLRCRECGYEVPAKKLDFN